MGTSQYVIRCLAFSVFSVLGFKLLVHSTHNSHLASNYGFGIVKNVTVFILDVVCIFIIYKMC